MIKVLLYILHVLFPILYVLLSIFPILFSHIVSSFFFFEVTIENSLHHLLRRYELKKSLHSVRL